MLNIERIKGKLLWGMSLNYDMGATLLNYFEV